MKSKISNLKFQTARARAAAGSGTVRPACLSPNCPGETFFPSRTRRQTGGTHCPTTAARNSFNSPLSTLHSFLAFSLVEVLLVMTLLSLIILALMNVFSTTQAAFRASVTQTDILEGSRAAMQMITDDLRGLTPSGSTSNVVGGVILDSVNFATVANSFAYAPLVQSLPASPGLRTNLLNYFFVLGRENNKWTGVGYIVDTTSATPLYPLYRFYAETNSTASPLSLYRTFNNTIVNAQWSNMSHIMDGVVHLAVRPHDPNGNWINTNNNVFKVANTHFLTPAYDETQMFMFSNTVPAAVELQLGVLEDRPLRRAESLPYNSAAQVNYLQQQAGRVHIFRQLVTIPNVDPSAYQ